MTSLVVPGAGTAIPPGLVMLVGAIGVACAFLQAILMLFRDGSVLLLAGSTALAGSGGFTNATNGWLPRLLTWQLALIFYKPAASLVYASAIWMQGENRSSDPRVLLMGIAMMVVALVALPVLLRFFTWTVGGLQSGGGGFGLLATAGAGGLHAASAIRGVGGGFAVNEHARYLAETFDRGSPPGPGPAPGSASRPGPGPGSGTGSRPVPEPATTPPGFTPPAFRGGAGGTATNAGSSGAPPGASGAASGSWAAGVPSGAATTATAGGGSAAGGGAGAATAGSAAAGPAAPVIAGAVVVAHAGTATARYAVDAAADAAGAAGAFDATNGR
jgi:hypothetical protein